MAYTSMAVTQDGGGGTLATGAANAHEFVENRLQDADSPYSPAELASEYGCGNQHLQNVCSELAQEGVIERVEEGQYVAAGESPESGNESDLTEGPEHGTEAAADSSDEGLVSPSSDRDAALVGGATAGAAAIPAVLEEVSTRQLVAMLMVAVALYLLFVRGGSGSSDPDGATEDEPATDGVEAGGLV